jgi:hypothetical protein
MCAQTHLSALVNLLVLSLAEYTISVQHVFTAALAAALASWRPRAGPGTAVRRHHGRASS